MPGFNPELKSKFSLVFYRNGLVARTNFPIKSCPALPQFEMRKSLEKYFLRGQDFVCYKKFAIRIWWPRMVDTDLISSIKSLFLIAKSKSKVIKNYSFQIIKFVWTYLSAFLEDVAVPLVVVARRSRLAEHVRDVQWRLVQLKGGEAGVPLTWHLNTIHLRTVQSRTIFL